MIWIIQLLYVDLKNFAAKQFGDHGWNYICEINICGVNILLTA